jgi:hypothetical protein
MAALSRSHLPRLLVLSVSLLCLAMFGPAYSGLVARQGRSSSELVVHEWGTFTSVAGSDGLAVKWHPRNGPYDLPSFVEHFHTADTKSQLEGTVRMETPVLYFYSPAKTTVSVRVGFSKGVITEWYPHASHIEPNPREILQESALYRQSGDGSIAWDSVTVEPGLAAHFPEEERESHYYAARETAAAPVAVHTTGSTQQEKFLFYRGVSIFSPPVSAQPSADGKVRIKNLGRNEIPSVILFERRGDRMGYRLGGAVQNELLLDLPELTSTPEALERDLQDALMSQGLYPDEARAMVQTWKLSWFEEGSRVFYLVPEHFVEAVLPLSIKPAPSQTVRVFVGRMEVITPATRRDIEQALARRDRAAIAKYQRFLEPILDQMKAGNPAHANELDRELSDVYSIPPSGK